MSRLDPGLRASQEERFDSFVSEAPDHTYSVSLHVTECKYFRVMSLSAQDSHLLCGFLEDFQGLVELLAGVFAGHDGADAGFAFGDGGEGDAGAEDARVEEGAGEIHGLAAVADDDGCDGGFAGGSVDAADVEAETAEFGLEVAGVFPEAIDALGLGFEQIEGGDAGSGHRWRVRGGKRNGRARW